MANYRIEYAGRNPEPFGEYRLRIYRDKRLVANYWYDYRGDEHVIEFLDGSSESYPVGQLTDFVQGGGPKPTALTTKAIEYLERKLQEVPK